MTNVAIIEEKPERGYAVFGGKKMEYGLASGNGVRVEVTRSYDTMIAHIVLDMGEEYINIPKSACGLHNLQDVAEKLHRDICKIMSETIHGKRASKKPAASTCTRMVKAF